MLPALNDWKNIVEELEAAGCRPWDPAQRTSLAALYSGVEEARRAAEALAAVHEVVPVDKLFSTLQRVATQFAAAEQQQEALGMVISSKPSRMLPGNSRHTNRVAASFTICKSAASTVRLSAGSSMLASRAMDSRDTLGSRDASVNLCCSSSDH